MADSLDAEPLRSGLLQGCVTNLDDEALALGWNTDRPDLRLIVNDDEMQVAERLDFGGHYDVAAPDLVDRYAVTVDAVNGGEVSA
jgi:hypothetical protein